MLNQTRKCEGMCISSSGWEMGWRQHSCMVIYKEKSSTFIKWRLRGGVSKCKGALMGILSMMAVGIRQGWHI
jgi:hypothetical protein